MSVYVIRAFVKMREDIAANSAILRRLAEIDKTLLVHDVTLREILQKLRPLLEPPPPATEARNRLPRQRSRRALSHETQSLRLLTRPSIPTGFGPPQLQTKPGFDEPSEAGSPDHAGTFWGSPFSTSTGER